jgi:autotransporter-associated beta strand protein
LSGGSLYVGRRASPAAPPPPPSRSRSSSRAARSGPRRIGRPPWTCSWHRRDHPGADSGGTARNITLSGILSDDGAVNGSLTKTGLGTLTLSGANSYTGATTVAAGALIINGAVASTSVVVNGSLGGSGVMANATLSGSGSINPGNSPGILTAAAADPGGWPRFQLRIHRRQCPAGMECPAASSNDVLRLTDATAPFTAALGGQYAMIYLNVGSLAQGDIFTGGFYTDRNAEFLSSIASGTFQYFLADDAGATTYAGKTYTAYSGPYRLRSRHRRPTGGLRRRHGERLHHPVHRHPRAPRRPARWPRPARPAAPPPELTDFRSNGFLRIQRVAAG